MSGSGTTSRRDGAGLGGLQVIRNIRKKTTSRWVGCLGPLAVMAFAGPAGAATGDAEAQKLTTSAMEGDYFLTKFDAAEAKLNRAADICEKKTCAPDVYARVYGYLAVIHGSAQKDYAAATEDLTEMLKLDGKQELDEKYANDELREALT